MEPQFLARTSRNAWFLDIARNAWFLDIEELSEGLLVERFYL